MDAGADLERAGKRFAEVVETLGKNYLSAMVGSCLVPVLKDALMECLADAKKETGTNNPDSIEERLRYNENEKEADLFSINVDNDTIMSTRYSSSFMAYDVWCVRIGVTNREDKEAKRKPFFVYGQKHKVRYQQIAKVPEKVKKDYPDAKLPAFPPEYVFSSTCCFCITTPAGNRQQHQEAVKTFFEAVNHDYPGKTLANFFKCGENYKVQQAMHDVFLQAFMATKRTVLRHSFSWELAPFDAVEALVQLLQAVADDEIIPDMVLRIPSVAPGCVRYRMIWNIRSVVFRAIDTAAQGWGPLSEAADKASEKVGVAIRDGADALVDAVKPILKKILTMVQDKMNDGKEGGEEKTEDTKRKLGDIVGSWQFQRSAPGAALFDGIVANGCKDAFANVAGDLANALVAAIKNPIDQMLERLLGGNLASNPFVQAVVENLVRRVVYKIQTLSSIQGFIDAAQVLAPIIDKMEADLAAVAGQGDAAFDGVIDSSSSALWKGLGSVGLNLFSTIYRLEGSLDRSGESDGATEPLLKFLKHMFVTQMRSFNAIRVTLCNNLRGKFSGAGDADAVKNIVRNEVRNAIFEIVNILVHEMFMTGQQALTNSAKVVVIDKFMDNVWPHISGPLNELAAEMPDALKSFGLDVVSLAETIIELLIGKIVGAVMLKVFLKVEEVVFSQ